ncbi:hypothetical protein CTI14_61625, partial [Methylobacterium radiotolerans]
SFLPPVLTFLTAAVIGVPIFRLIGQSAVLGYLASRRARAKRGPHLRRSSRTAGTITMASPVEHASFLPPVLTFLTAAVIGVPIFRLIGQSAVLGYL